MISMRNILIVLAIPAFLGAGLTLYAVVIEPSRLVVRHVELETQHSQSETFRVALIADLHVGSPMSGLGKVRRVVEAVNAEEPDVVLLLGDYLISGVLLGSYVEPEPIADLLTDLEAPLGVYSVLGNHDWWEDGPGMTTALEVAGIPVLENQARAIGEDLWLVGLADDTTRQPNINAGFAGVPQGVRVLVIAHDPAVYLDWPVEREAVLMAAGHTHGGQIYLPWLFAPVIPGRAGPEWAHGLHDAGGQPLYVSSGIGTSILPVRINRPPEIVIVDVPLP